MFRGWWKPLILGLGLLACDEAGDPERDATLARVAPAALRVAGGEVTLAGPQGFCIDPRSVRMSEDGATFALMGSCASLANARSVDAPRRRAVLSATVAAPSGFLVSENAGAMLAFLQTEAGAASLSGTGQSSDVQIGSVRAEGGAVLVQASDAGLGPAGQFQPGYWRGFFDVQGRVVTVSVLSLVASPLKPADGEKLLADVIAAIRAANVAAPA